MKTNLSRRFFVVNVGLPGLERSIYTTTTLQTDDLTVFEENKSGLHYLRFSADTSTLAFGFKKSIIIKRWIIRISGYLNPEYL